MATGPLLSIFEHEGQARDVTGHQPLPLGDGTAVWLVRSGRVDVFATAAGTEGRDGGRVHVLRAEAGQALFGVEPSDPSTRLTLLATGAPGTAVVRLPLARLRELACDAALAGPVAVMLETWIEALTAGTSRAPPPRVCRPLESGKELALEDGAHATPTRGTLWVQHREGASCFLGKEGLPVTTATGLFPLAASGWLQARGRALLSAQRTECLLGDPALWSSLERFHQLILRCLALNAQDAAAADAERLRKGAAADELRTHGALMQLASVIGAESTSDITDHRPPEPLLLACRLVGEALAITVKAPSTPAAGRKRGDQLRDIALASRFRLRRVLLAGEWWQTDTGPLLAFRTDGDQPVALLPTSPTSYELADPAGGTRSAVTAESAAGLAPFAFSFYRPFPASAVAAWELVRFGFRGCRKDLRLLIVLAVLGGLLGLLAPIFTAIIFDRVVPGAERGQLLLLTLGLVVSAFAAALFQFTRGIAILRVEGRMDSAVEAGVWDRLLSLPVPFFRGYTAGDLATRAMGVGMMRRILTGVVVSTILTSVFSFFNLGLLFFYDVRLAAVAAVLVLVVLLALGLTIYSQLRYQRSIHRLRGKIAGSVLQFVTGIGRLRVAGAEERALARWAGEFSGQKRLALSARAIGNRFVVFNAAMSVITSMVLFAMVALYTRGLSVGAFLAFNAAFVQLLLAALALGPALTALIQVVPLYERLQPVLETLPEVPPAKSDPGELSGEIEVGHVTFAYRPDAPLVLHDVSLHVKPGAFVAFVGPSGAGKSSILRLLLGFESPGSGSIYFDRQDLAGLDLQAVRRQMGVVLQNGRVISGDILTNIVGSSLLTLDDAWEAARLSGLDDDIRQMPMGMHTIISEGGATLSGGQRQRLMIARAVAHRPRILLFDEATSALDNRTQAIVSESLQTLKATRIVVAHRLSTVINADCIYVLDAGRIVQHGRYEELLRQGGLFTELVKRQMI